MISMSRKEIELAIAPMVIGLTTNKDHWTFVGDMRSNGEKGINSIEILIHVKNCFDWFQRRRKSINSLFSNTETIIQNRKYKAQFNNMDIYFIIIEGRESFGLAELIFSLEKSQRMILLDRIKSQGFEIEKGKIIHAVLKEIFNFPTAKSILNFTNLQFDDFISDFKGYSNV